MLAMTTDNIVKLAPRERQILGLLAQGYTRKRTAKALGISVWTVHSHVRRAMDRNNVGSVLELMLKARDMLHNNSDV